MKIIYIIITVIVILALVGGIISIGYNYYQSPEYIEPLEPDENIKNQPESPSLTDLTHAHMQMNTQSLPRGYKEPPNQTKYQCFLPPVQ
jgi:cell division protein FtsL